MIRHCHAVRPVAAIQIAIAVLSLSACGGAEDSASTNSGQPERPSLDDLSGLITNDQLALLPLPLEEFGPEYSVLEAAETPAGYLDRQDKALAADRPPDASSFEDEENDLERFGWEAGYAKSYVNTEGLSILRSHAESDEDEPAPYVLGSLVDLFESNEGAAGYLADMRDEFVATAGTTDSGGFTTDRVEMFDADVSDESYGFDIDSSLKDDETSRTVYLHSSALVFRRHNLLVQLSITWLGARIDPDKLRDELREGARKQNDHILAVLRGDMQPDRTPGPQAAGKIAFLSDRAVDDGVNIYIINADGSGLTKLTNNPGHYQNLAWSPDGTRLALSHEPESEYCYCLEIYVMSADGSGLTRITTGGESEVIRRRPRWSPDGRRIAFFSENRLDRRLHVVNRDGSGLTELIDLSEIEEIGVFDVTPVWSPDGSRIAFSVSDEIYVINADGSGLTRVTNNSFEDKDVSWSPDGESILFSSNRDPNFRNFDIYVMNADGTGVEALTQSGGHDSSPIWSPGGSRIAFLSTGTSDGSNVYIMNADGSNKTRLTEYASADLYDPIWSPDGNHIAFLLSDGDGVDDILVVGVDGSGLVNLTDSPADDDTPAWFPAR